MTARCEGTVVVPRGMCDCVAPGCEHERVREQIASERRWAEAHADKETETRIVDSETGGEKGEKLQQFSEIPGDWLWELASVYGYGANKYSRGNFLRGYQWTLSYDALQRHITQWLRGESVDSESGRHHLAHAAWHLATLFVFERRGLGTDDLRGNHR